MVQRLLPRMLAICLLLFPLANVAFTSDAAAAEYGVTDLHGIGIGSSAGEDINADGSIVGEWDESGALWQGGQLQELDSLADVTASWAVSINSSGAVAGYAQLSPVVFVAVAWQDGEMRYLEALPELTYSRAFGINEHGVIVGEARVSEGEASAPVRWDDGVPTLLPIPADASAGVALAINRDGTSVGRVNVSGEGWQATRWDGSGTQFFPGLVSADATAATAINDTGDAVGYAHLTSGVYLAIAWQTSGLRLLPPLEGDDSSVAYDINNSGQIVGFSFRSGETTRRAVIWEQGGASAIALPQLPGSLESQANAINDAGVITGVSTQRTDLGESMHAVTWSVGNAAMTASPAALDGSSSYRVVPVGRSTYATAPMLAFRWGPAINDAGQIASQTAEPALRSSDPDAVLYRGMVTDPSGETTVLYGAPESRPFAINSQGQVVGHAYFSLQPNLPGTAVLWGGDDTAVLGTLGGDWSIAYGINDAGQVVGISSTESGTSAAFLWSDGQLTALPMLTGATHSGAYAINERGDIVGYAVLETGEQRAVIWQNGVVRALPLRSGDQQSTALALNDAGVIVGWSGAHWQFNHEPVVWTGDQVSSLGLSGGATGGRAHAVNEAGQIVGQVWSAATVDQGRAVLWTGAETIDLGALAAGSTASSATGINAAGDIVGWAIAGGDELTVRWTTSPPEPPLLAEGTPVQARWCVPAGEDMLQGLSLALTGIFQHRSLLVSGPTVIAPTQDPPSLVSINVETGVVAWRHDVPESQYGLLIADRDPAGLIAFVAPGRDQTVIGAVDSGTGERIWSVTVAGSTGYPPVVSSTMVYASTGAGTVLAFDLASGALLWAQSAPASGPIVLIDGQTLLVGLDDGAIAAFDPSSGEAKWTVTTAAGATGSYDSWIWTAVSGDGVAIFAAREGEVELEATALYGIDGATGATRWSRRFDSELVVTPVVLDGRVYAATSAGTLLSLDLLTGEEVWKKTDPAGGVAWIAVAQPAAGDSSVLVAGLVFTEADGSGRVASVQLDGGTIEWVVWPEEIALLDAAPVEAGGLVVMRGFTMEAAAMVCAYERPTSP